MRVRAALHAAAASFTMPPRAFYAADICSPPPFEM
jgi:hypothetical protein